VSRKSRRARRRAVAARRPPVGARPGTLAIPAGGPAPRIRLIRYGPDAFDERPIADVEELARLGAGFPVTWVDVQGFGDERVLLRLRDLFRIHPLALADVVNIPQRPKYDDYDDRDLLVLRAVERSPAGEVGTSQVSLVLGPGFVVSFQEHDCDAFEPVRARLRAKLGIVRQMGADFLAYALMDVIVDRTIEVVEALGEVLDEVEERMLARSGADSLQQLHRVRRQCFALERVQWRQRDALQALLRDESSPLAPEVQVYARDVLDHVVQLVDMLDTYRELAVSLLDMHLSAQTQRTNEVMKTLTVIASIFIPLTFVVGIYGMNFDHMPELRWRWGYPATLAVMSAIALALLAWFRRRGWIGAEDGGAPDGQDAPK
jgi:magnesium transporter